VLAASQIRELMGSVPNTVFERLLEAVAAGESARLMEELNQLLNAGHSPQSLARQMVRYLRNTLMAKLGGEQTELLQISGDERARAARTAMLFTEEDLTRNLQIVLRTFDDLNYRQEQRFHLELGLLKLVHAQRLLPLEELLSGVASGAGVRSVAPVRRPASGSSNPSSTASTTASPSVPRATSATAAPARSPFGSASGSSPVMHGPAPTTESPRPAPVLELPTEALPAPARQVTPFPVVSSQSNGFAEPLTEGSLAKAPAPPAPEGSPDVAVLCHAVVEALAAGGHATASQLLSTGSWTLEGSSLRIEVPGMGKKMLALTVNAAAEKIIRQELQRLGAPARFMVVPGEGKASSAVVGAMPQVGSIQEAALADPMVRLAKEIFAAEIRSVLDLRGK
jgi:DNA polymerase-3 subunit gamma/tau